MGAKQTIRKILFISLWVCIGAGMLTLLLAAINNKNKGLCKGYKIEIKGGDKNRFIDEKDIEQLLFQSVGGNIKGQALSSINLNKIEQELGKSIWVSKVEVYFDNQNELFITIAEREPIARIFTTRDSSFYIDSAGNKLPLSEKLSAKVPVFTGYPDKKVLDKNDSLLLTNIRRVAKFILHNDFWMAQVAQIDITDYNEMEMLPVVGNHIVELGNGSEVEDKFKRLMIFYQQVLSKVGLDKYKIIDARFKGQIVASSQGKGAKVDSVLLRKNVEKMLQDARNAEMDTVIKPLIVPGKYVIPMDSTVEIIEDSHPEDVLEAKPKQEESKLIKQPKTLMPKNKKDQENLKNKQLNN